MIKKIATIRGFGVRGTVKLFFDFILSKILFPQVRILRRPFYIRNEGSLTIGKGFSSAPGLIIDIFGGNARVEIGDNVMAYHGLHIGAIDSVKIGDRVLIASGVYISDHSHGNYSGESQSNPLEPPAKRPLSSSSVKIEADVWLGENVSVLPGVFIGKGSIIGAGSVVISKIPDYSIAVGVPAKVIKRFNFDSEMWESYSA